MTNKFQISMFVIACVLVFAVMVGGYNPVQDLFKYMFPILAYKQVNYYQVYGNVDDSQ